jgi:hypothetical protein
MLDTSFCVRITRPVAILKKNSLTHTQHQRPLKEPLNDYVMFTFAIMQTNSQM